MDEFLAELHLLCAQNGIELSKEQSEQMSAYYEQLRETNAQYNITAITEPRQAALKHFYDSIVPAAQLPDGAAVADVGSGGGFPAVPLKIVRPDLSMCAIEASGKKCAFIERACTRIGIEMEVINGRAEEMAHSARRESFDVCVSRAVAALPILLELCIPLIRPNGLMFAYKGDDKRELQEAQNAMRVLDIRLKETVKMRVEGYGHSVLIFEKEAPSAKKYPRNYAQISKRPL